MIPITVDLPAEINLTTNDALIAAENVSATAVLRRITGDAPRLVPHRA
jgi:hypothetical protein